MISHDALQQNLQAPSSLLCEVDNYVGGKK